MTRFGFVFDSVAFFIIPILFVSFLMSACANNPNDTPADSIESATWKQVSPPREGMECWRRVGERATMCVWSDGE